MDDTIDSLKIKIDKATRELPQATQNAIAAVDWKTAILGLRAKKGYTFEQLGDLELETELLLSGLVSGKDYPKELENRMGISKTATNELLTEMNNLVFRKIQEELIKGVERKKAPVKNSPLEEYPLGGGGSILSTPSRERATPQEGNKDAQILDKAGIKVVETTLPGKTMDIRREELGESREDILKRIELPEPVRSPIGGAPTILSQKLSGSFQTPIVKTEHTIENITKSVSGVNEPPKIVKKLDPYREVPE